MVWSRLVRKKLNRILGHGDLISVIENAQNIFDGQKSLAIEKILSNKFDLMILEKI